MTFALNTTAFDDPPIFVVLNAVAGHSDTETTCQAISQVLTEAGRAHRILRVDDPRQLKDVAREAVERARQSGGVVVAAGGDGTLNAVAQATLGHCPFGVIPQGTFNYFGRTHGMSSDTTEATRTLLTAYVKPVQVGLANERMFLVNASVGLYPQLLKDREEQKRRHGRSRLVALWAAWLTLWRGYRPMRISVEHDSERREQRTLTLFIGNNRLQLEQVGVHESAAVEQGQLVAITVRPMPTRTLLWLALKGAMGELGKVQGVEHFALTRLTVVPSGRRLQRIRIATDGEVDWIASPIEFRVAPQPLLLLVPRDATPETAR